MDTWLKISFVVLAFIGMEFVAWSFHKFLMHGVLWPMHKDHHQKNMNRKWEVNDFFFPVFATPGIVLISFGFNTGMNHPWFWLGIGLAFYGIAYALVHDIIIHQRIKILTKWNNVYIRAIRKAHKVHHKHLGKEDGENFGFLYVSKKHLNEVKQQNVLRTQSNV